LRQGVQGNRTAQKFLEKLMPAHWYTPIDHDPEDCPICENHKANPPTDDGLPSDSERPAVSTFGGPAGAVLGPAPAKVACPYWPGCGCGTQSGPHTCKWKGPGRSPGRFEAVWPDREIAAKLGALELQRAHEALTKQVGKAWPAHTPPVSADHLVAPFPERWPVDPIVKVGPDSVTAAIHRHPQAGTALDPSVRGTIREPFTADPYLTTDAVMRGIAGAYNNGLPTADPYTKSTAVERPEWTYRIMYSSDGASREVGQVVIERNGKIVAGFATRAVGDSLVGRLADMIAKGDYRSEDRGLLHDLQTLVQENQVDNALLARRMCAALNEAKV
jgi:hypothetical protein